MSKYDEFNEQGESLKVEEQLLMYEQVLWRGKPSKKAYIVNKIVGLLPMALFWLAIDMTFIVGIFVTGSFSWYLIIFFMIHLMPVWMWLSNIITSGKQWQNTE